MAEETKVQIITHAPPPPELPVYQREDPREVCFFGRTNYAAALEEKRFIFGIKRYDRRRHIYITGKPGMGKSKLFELLIRQDIAYGYGLCFLDPQGELIDNILDFVPKERVADTVLVDPSDAEFPAAFNPLANVKPESRHRLTESFVEIFRKQLAGDWSPRLEHLLRLSFSALLDYPEATLYGLISLLKDPEYRHRISSYAGNEIVKKFWSEEFEDWSKRFESEAVIPLLNKSMRLLSDPLLSGILSGKENKIDLDAIVKNKKILLVNLAKSKLGEENASFLGSLFVARIKQAGLNRAHLSEKDRTDFYMYVDEFNNLLTPDFESLFLEGRKYGIPLAVSNQYISQLSPHSQVNILGNSGTIIVFKVLGDDARRLESEMAPVFKARDMTNLGVKEFYIKLMINGNSYDPFSGEALKITAPVHESFRKEIISESRTNYSVSR